MKKIKVYFHGYLKKLFPKPIELQAETAYEAIRNISFNYPQFKAPLDIGRYRIRIKDYDSLESLKVPLFTDSLHIYPFFKMGKSSGWVQIAVGVALIATGGIALGVYGSALATAAAGTATTAASGTAAAALAGLNGLVYAGVGMLVGGIISLLAPQPKLDNDMVSDPSASKYLGAPKNTVAVGTRIPIGYGLFRVYGHYISFNINAVDTI